MRRDTRFLTTTTLSAIFIIFINGAKAQPNVPLNDQMDYITAPLDFTEVTSGLLLDRGFQMMNVAEFDGSTASDTLFNYGDWFRQYGTMVTSKINEFTPLGRTSDWKPLSDSLLREDVIPLMILHAEYHKFIEDSTLLSTLIYYTKTS